MESKPDKSLPRASSLRSGRALVGEFFDRISTLFWVRFRLQPGWIEPPVVNVWADTQEKESPVPHPPFLRKINTSYPIDSSFIKPMEWPVPQTAILHGVSFLFDERCNPEDRAEFKSNFAYRLFVLEKWFHEGPIRLFPLVAHLDSITGELPVLQEPWIDAWEIPRVVMPGMQLGIALQGNAVKLSAELDIMIAMFGYLDRPVQ